MSEPNEVFGTQNDEDLDIDAIFGSSAEATADPLPFSENPQTATADETPVLAEAASATEDAAAPEAAETGKPTEANPEAEQDLFAAFSGEAADPAPAPAAKQNAPTAQQTLSLFDKPPIFKYGSAKDPIEDASMTFEELRIKKADDFPELEDGKKVSWSVKYGDVTKPIAQPKETTIAKVKEEIEKSKPFLDAIKKGKVKDPECFVMPKVTAGSKGIASYKGVFPTVEAARRSDKIINLIPSSDGRIYELRKTELGEFIAPKSRITDFSEVRAGFTPALPLIPRELMGQLISFFRSFMSDGVEVEALALVYWDRQEEEFVLHIPQQKTSKAYIGFKLDAGEFPEDRYLHYADIHSHNSMAAKFSAVDDADEKATRLYIVVGRLQQFYPDISARVSCGGTYLGIDAADVIEGVGEEFPPEWLEKVERQKPNDSFGMDDPKLKRALEAVFA
jgi:hypothetical protein